MLIAQSIKTCPTALRIPDAGSAESVQGDALATKAAVDDDEPAVEDGEEDEREDEHEDVVERVEVDELVGEAVADLGALQSVDVPRPVVDRLANQLRLHPARNVERHREHSHRRHACTPTTACPTTDRCKYPSGKCSAHSGPYAEAFL